MSSVDTTFLAKSTQAQAAGVMTSSFNGQDQYQRTLRGEAQCSGVGVHSGETITLRLLPAKPDTGIVFVRTDLKNGARAIKARWDNVTDTRLCTVISNDHGGHVSTVEHLMAALRSKGIDNVIAEVDGPEVPVMDGSSDSFVFLIEMAGVVEQNAYRDEIIVLKKVEIVDDDKYVALLPADEASFCVDISFADKLIGEQHFDLTLSDRSFKTELSRARTFGFIQDVEKMRAHGLMLGGSLDNAVVIKDSEVMNEGGLRFKDEFVRHKMLDAIGDIAMAGAPLRGRFVGRRPGHAMNNKILRTLFADPTAWMCRSTMPESMAVSA